MTNDSEFERRRQIRGKLNFDVNIGVSETRATDGMRMAFFRDVSHTLDHLPVAGLNDVAGELCG